MKYLRHLVSVKCKDCQKTWLKRRDSIKFWQGRCRSCNEKNRAAQELEMRSKRARLQVVRQGGIPNARKFDRVNNSGENHPKWKGGITSENQKARGSQAYIDWRLAVFIRDEFTCIVCGQVGGKLHAHHIKAWADFPDLRFEISNGVTACKKCHEAILHNGNFNSKPGHTHAA